MSSAASGAKDARLLAPDAFRSSLCEIGEQRYHHIIHPSTGTPTSGVVSTTVIGPESMRCDALSTSVFVLGVERGLALINKMAGYDAILIDSAGKVHYSQDLQGQ